MNRTQEHSEALEREHIDKIRQGDECAFKEIFLAYYPRLCALAADYLKSHDLGREVVQEVFLGIWERRRSWHPEGPLRPYLYRAVCNRSINHIKKHQTRREAASHYAKTAVISENNVDHEFDLKELNKILWEAVAKLPKKRYLIFVLHRRHQLSYKEIAQSMDISVKTVENQMGQALKFLRKELTPDYFS